MLLQERQEVFQFLLKYVFDEVTTDRDQLVRKQQNTQKRSFFSFLGFKKSTEKSGPTLTMTPYAEDGFTFNSVPSTAHGLQFHHYIIHAIPSFFQNLSN